MSEQESTESVDAENIYLKIALSPEQADSYFVTMFKRIAESAHNCSKKNGFWEGEQNDGEKIALMHSELSEALEALRKKNPPDDKIKNFSAVEAELADVIIRIMDYGVARNMKIAQAVIEKNKYNMERPFKHGKEF